MIINLNQQNPEPKKIEQIVTVLKNGGIVVYPTDTIYGLGCDIFNKPAIEKIYRFKKREGKKPLSIMCADIKDISKYALIPDYAFVLLKRYLPGPYTFILKAKNSMPGSFLSKNKTVGVRIPANTICLEIIKALGSPIITTSLNLSGEPVLSSPSQLNKEVKNQIDLIIDQGSLPQIASTIVDLTADPPKILRQGSGEFAL
ncbi:MAG: L-threonylcarbamoyladenylate synthase [Candidatus Parcubacteria bacterium]|nr:L-threonylcarbamoyladenylate synthase [Candidatus Parcubacteria bacterium]